MADAVKGDADYSTVRKNVASARKNLRNVVAWSAAIVTIGLTSFVGIAVRDPVQPPSIYYEPIHAQISHYEGRKIKVTAKPLAVFPPGHDSKKSGLEIVLELEDGSFLRTAPGTIHGLSSYRLDNKPSDQNVQSLYSALRHEIKSGRGTKITLIGNLNNGVLEAYGASIGGTPFPIVNYNPSKLDILK